MSWLVLVPRWWHPVARWRQRRFWAKIARLREPVEYFGVENPWYKDGSE